MDSLEDTCTATICDCVDSFEDILDLPLPTHFKKKIYNLSKLKLINTILKNDRDELLTKLREQSDPALLESFFSNWKQMHLSLLKHYKQKHSEIYWKVLPGGGFGEEQEHRHQEQLQEQQQIHLEDLREQEELLQHEREDRRKAIAEGKKTHYTMCNFQTTATGSWDCNLWKRALDLLEQDGIIHEKERVNVIYERFKAEHENYYDDFESEYNSPRKNDTIGYRWKTSFIHEDYEKYVKEPSEFFKLHYSGLTKKSQTKPHHKKMMFMIYVYVHSKELDAPSIKRPRRKDTPYSEPDVIVID